MDELEKKLREVYKAKGMQFVYEVCKSMLSIKDNTGKKRTVNGNVCEILLCLMTEEYLSKKKMDGFIARSVILKDPKKPQSDFRTEIDFLFCTKQMVFCTECKSYVGEKRITDKFTLHTNNREFDVYKQNQIHVETLYKNISLAKVKQTDKYNIAMSGFLFSNGDIHDMREERYKQIMPAITQNNLYQFYNTLLGSHSSNVWDLAKLKRIISTILSNKNLRAEHKSYVGYQ